MSDIRYKEHIIQSVTEGSIADECGIEPGDVLLAIDDSPIEDIFDYQYLTESEELSILIRGRDGQEYICDIEKDEDEDIGLVFEAGLMDEYRSCKNKCIFCFIDQMPSGMRDTLYFKDDDSRLSFLQGNYITLTGLSERDVERIINYNLSPINISFHTVDKKLRCEMLHNRFAGDALSIVDRFYEAGIEMNGQIVLCRGINDGDRLRESIEKLSGYIPHLRSLSVVPVGLSRHRDGLYHLESFDRESACEVIDIIEGYQRSIYESTGTHFVHAGDEWYIMAGREMPPEDSYDGYLQLENGVGMLRLFTDEFYGYLEELKAEGSAIGHSVSSDQGNPVSSDRRDPVSSNQGNPISSDQGNPISSDRRDSEPEKENGNILVSVATGVLMYPFIRDMCAELESLANSKCLDKNIAGLRIAGEPQAGEPQAGEPQAGEHLLTIKVYEIKNYFFGERITVSGLLTGRDIIDQLKGENLGERLLLPENILRAGETVLLDDITVEDIERELEITVVIVPESGRALIDCLLGSGVT